MQAYDERLTAPRSWWLLTVLVAVASGLLVAPFGALATLGGLLAGGTLSAVALNVYGSARIRVVADSLVAGEARIPLSALGEARALDPQETRDWRMHRADPRAFMLLRGYVPTAVRVVVTDPQDPTPYVYLSTRRPDRLVAALEQARAQSAPGAGEPAATE